MPADEVTSLMQMDLSLRRPHKPGKALTMARAPTIVLGIVIIVFVLILGALALVSVKRIIEDMRATREKGCELIPAAVAVAVLLVLGAAATWYLASAVLRSWMEHYNMGIFGTRVTLGSLWINPFSGLVEVKRLRVHNPPGFGDGSVLTARTVQFDVHLGQMMYSVGSTIYVDRVVVNGTRLLYAARSGTSNLRAMLSQLESLPTEPTEGQGAHDVVLNAVDIRNSLVHLGQPLQVPDIHIGSLDQRVRGNLTEVPASRAIAYLAVRLLTDALALAEGRPWVAPAEPAPADGKGRSW